MYDTEALLVQPSEWIRNASTLMPFKHFLELFLWVIFSAVVGDRLEKYTTFACVGVNEEDELKLQVLEKEADLETARTALREVGLPPPAGGLVGGSSAIRVVRSLIERAAPTELPVLITGPSGSGKELAARAMHELSPRRKGPFISENCAALPPDLIESELFGTSKGAYTGADRDRPGMFERAQRGTLFLDEVGELPPELQAKLLRVLETREVRRVGESSTRSVDFRLVVATNRDLEQEVGAGAFREDLYYRLNGLRVELLKVGAANVLEPFHCLTAPLTITQVRRHAGGLSDGQHAG